MTTETPAPAEALSLLEKLSEAMKSSWVAGRDFVVITNRPDAYPFDADVMAVLSALPEIHAALARAESAEAERDRLREKAALWDGLLGMTRVRALGWAGMNEDGTPAERDPRGDPYNGYAHLGLELWTKFPDNLHEFPTELARHERGKVLLTGIARISAALATQEARHD